MRRAIVLRRRGTLLVEMLFGILLVAVTILIATRLLQTLGRVYRDAPSASAKLQTQSQWLRMMRDDAWAARSVETKAAEVTLDLSDDRVVVWRIEGGQLQRSTPNESQRWPEGRAMGWASTTAMFSVTVGDDVVGLATPGVSIARRP